MSDLQKTGWIAFLVIMLLLGSFFFGKCSSAKPIISKSTKADTVYTTIIKDGPHVNIDSLKATMIRYKDKFVMVPYPAIAGDTSHHDSIAVLPFEVCLDTIINRDTFGLKFYYPANFFSLNFKLKPDSITQRLIKVTETITVEKQEAWYIKPAIFLTGGLLGYIGGRIQK